MIHFLQVYKNFPSSSRRIALQGLLLQSCQPQLSLLSRHLPSLLRFDLISAVPPEVALRIFRNLDAQSLGRTACVSKSWKRIAEDEEVWKLLCAQHIGGKCRSCGWGLPILEAGLKATTIAEVPTSAIPSNVIEAVNKKKKKRKRRPICLNSANSTTTAAVAMERGCSGIDKQREVESDEDNSGDEDVDDDETTVDYPGNITSKRPCCAGDNFPSANAPSQNNSLGKGICSSVCIPNYRDDTMRTWKTVYTERLLVERNWRKGNCRSKMLRGHQDSVTCLQFTDTHLFSGSYDNTIRVWDLNLGVCLRVLKGHQGCVRALQADAVKLVTASTDRTIRVWNWHTGECVRVLQGHVEAVAAVGFEKAILVSGGAEGVLRVWNFEDGECFDLHGHRDCVNELVVCGGAGEWVFSASDDTTVRMWQISKRRCFREFLGHIGQVQCVRMVGDMRKFQQDIPLSGESDDPQRKQPLLVTGAWDNTIRIWSVNSGDCLKTLFGHMEGVWSVAVDRLRVASGSHDGLVKLWDLESGECMHTFCGGAILGRTESAVNSQDAQHHEHNNRELGEEHHEHIEEEEEEEEDGEEGEESDEVIETPVPTPVPAGGRSLPPPQGGSVSCVGLSETRLGCGGDEGVIRIWEFGI